VLAASAAAAGDMDEAMEHAREAFSKREPGMIPAKYFASGKHLRDDSRFNELLARMRFP
jgi:hypothetical protein